MKTNNDNPNYNNKHDDEYIHIICIYISALILWVCWWDNNCHALVNIDMHTVFKLLIVDVIICVVGLVRYTLIVGGLNIGLNK